MTDGAPLMPAFLLGGSAAVDADGFFTMPNLGGLKIIRVVDLLAASATPLSLDEGGQVDLTLRIH